MKLDVNSVRLLYRMGKITTEGVHQACERGWITAEQYQEITGEAYN